MCHCEPVIVNVHERRYEAPVARPSFLTSAFSPNSNHQEVLGSQTGLNSRARINSRGSALRSILALRPIRFGIAAAFQGIRRGITWADFFINVCACARLTPWRSRPIIPPCRSQTQCAASKTTPRQPASCININFRMRTPQARAPRRETNTSITFLLIGRRCFPSAFLFPAMPSSAGARKPGGRLPGRKNMPLRR